MALDPQNPSSSPEPSVTPEPVRDQPVPTLQQQPGNPKTSSLDSGQLDLGKLAEIINATLDAREAAKAKASTEVTPEAREAAIREKENALAAREKAAHLQEFLAVATGQGVIQPKSILGLIDPYSLGDEKAMVTAIEALKKDATNHHLFYNPTQLVAVQRGLGAKALGAGTTEGLPPAKTELGKALRKGTKYEEGAPTTPIPAYFGRAMSPEARVKAWERHLRNNPPVQAQQTGRG